MEASGMSDAGVERVVRDLSSHLASTLGSLGYQRHGIEKEDLLQEIHIKIWKTLRANNRHIQYFNAYLRKIVYSVFINEINRIHKEHEILEKGGTCLSPYLGAGGSADVETAALENVLAASIDGLKESRQRVLRLRLQGFTLNEIATLNKWPYRKTCSIFYRGLKELKGKLRDRGVRYED
jgi:RNA polymerase sigma factor (sigma-70 family)